ncbi:hypothetical protein A2U01_0091671 [Trifolium medium]|uniref:Uncharacterized protein n=1 Tax=Trifolium medium TaxID=97028 RepID=A0A392UBI7_9FABA|nr:hypothetical protein [Trifolium medium]
MKWNELEQQVVGTVRRGVIGPSLHRGDVTETGKVR